MKLYKYINDRFNFKNLGSRDGDIEGILGGIFMVCVMIVGMILCIIAIGWLFPVVLLVSILIDHCISKGISDVVDSKQTNSVLTMLIKFIKDMRS